ncbi:MAG: AMP-binding protein [Clostridia bacterium]|nr:AMP-binding protein [Clostridia bacterium]
MRFNTIKELLNNSIEKFSNNTLYEIDGEKITYADFKHMVDSLGTCLVNMGLKDKRIAVIGKNSMHWEVSYLSITCGTGVIVPLDKSLPFVELESSIERSEIEAIFFDESYEEDIVKISKNGNNKLKYLISMGEATKEGVLKKADLIKKGEELLAEGKREFLEATIDPEALAILLFTSGTTANSKAVMLSNHSMCSCVSNVMETLNDIGQDDTFLSFLPLHHVFEGSVGFLFPIAVGSKIIFCRGVRYIAEDLRLNHITVLMCVPAVYESMYKTLRKKLEKEGKLDAIKALEAKADAENLSLDQRKELFKFLHEAVDDNVKYLISGAAALEPEVEKGFRNWGFHLVQGYGLSEFSPVVSVETRDNYRLSSIGRPLANVTAKIINPDSEGLGELVVYGESKMLGYMGDDEANAEVFSEDGGIKTGDLATIDKDGFIFIKGRKKSVIVLKNGKNVFPEEIEKAINLIPNVKESFVFGKPKSDDITDIKLNALIVYDEEEFKDKTEEEITKHFKDIINKEINPNLPKYKHILGLVVTNEPLIKTTTGKIKRDNNLAKFINK